MSGTSKVIMVVFFGLLGFAATALGFWVNSRWTGSSSGINWWAAIGAGLGSAIFAAFSFRNY